MKCPKCGSNNDLDAKFCEKCGNNLNSKVIKGKQSNINIKYLIIICVILVLGLSIAAGYLLQGNTSSNQQTQNNAQITQSTGFPVSEAPNLASELSKTNGNIENVQYQGITLNKNQCLYILAKSIVMINNGESSNIPIKAMGNADAPYGELNSASITKTEYIDMADRTYKWMDTNGRSPNHTGIIFSGSPDLSPDMTLKAFTQVLTEYKATGKLPDIITV